MSKYLESLLPDDVVNIIYEYDGRYDKSRLMPSLKIIDFRLSFKYNSEYEETTLYRCWDYFNTVVNKHYEEEYTKQLKKYDKDCNLITGEINGITGPLKKGDGTRRLSCQNCMETECACCMCAKMTLDF